MQDRTTIPKLCFFYFTQFLIQLRSIILCWLFTFNTYLFVKYQQLIQKLLPASHKLNRNQINSRIFMMRKKNKSISNLSKIDQKMKTKEGQDHINQISVDYIIDKILRKRSAYQKINSNNFNPNSNLYVPVSVPVTSMPLKNPQSSTGSPAQHSLLQKYLPQPTDPRYQNFQLQDQNLQLRQQLKKIQKMLKTKLKNRDKFNDTLLEIQTVRERLRGVLDASRSLEGSLCRLRVAEREKIKGKEADGYSWECCCSRRRKQNHLQQDSSQNMKIKAVISRHQTHKKKGLQNSNNIDESTNKQAKNHSRSLHFQQKQTYKQIQSSSEVSQTQKSLQPQPYVHIDIQCALNPSNSMYNISTLKNQLHQKREYVQKLKSIIVSQNRLLEGYENRLSQAGQVEARQGKGKLSIGGIESSIVKETVYSKNLSVGRFTKVNRIHNGNFAINLATCASIGSLIKTNRSNKDHSNNKIIKS